MSETSSDWELLKSFVEANNKSDSDTFYSLLNENNLSDKPRVVSAVMMSIEITERNVRENKDILLKFVEEVIGVKKDFKTDFRYHLLREALGAEDLLTKKNE